MKKKDNEPAAGAALRRSAERKLKAMSDACEDLSGMTPEDTARLIHELRVHQIELSSQNEELRHIQAELEKAGDRYFHLYDFAPVGYLTVNDNGLIEQANLTAATMLGSERSRLVGQYFSHYIRREDQDIWYLHRRSLLDTGKLNSFQLRLVKNGGGSRNS